MTRTTTSSSMTMCTQRSRCDARTSSRSASVLITSSSSSAKHAIHLGERQVLGRNENFFSLSLTPLLQPNILGQLLVPLDVLLGIDPSPASWFPIRRIEFVQLGCWQIDYAVEDVRLEPTFKRRRDRRVDEPTLDSLVELALGPFGLCSATRLTVIHRAQEPKVIPSALPRSAVILSSTRCTSRPLRRPSRVSAASLLLPRSLGGGRLAGLPSRKNLDASK